MSMDKEQQKERTPLLDLTTRSLRSKHKKRCCIQSQAGLLILCWNLLLRTFMAVSLEQIVSIPLNLEEPVVTEVYAPLYFSVRAIMYLFYPLAGCLADIKCGRYKTVIYSLWIITLDGTVLLPLLGTLIFYYDKVLVYYMYLLPFICLLVIIAYASYGAFRVNTIQFGMDQLHDSPAEDSVLFIHWFVLTSHVGSIVYTISRTATYSNILTTHISFVGIMLGTIFLLGASLCIGKCKRHWFMIDSGSRNPYKLVYKVIKFAAQHKSPIHRSAFTYCEDELPSRMDLAKEKYGGPFTTEQVEDVKAFLGILRVLLTLGPVFSTDIAINRLLPTVAAHLDYNTSYSNQLYFNIIQFNGVPEIMITILISIYVCLLRPFIHRYIPGILKRMGLGMTLLLLSGLSILLIDTVGHLYHPTKICFLSSDYINTASLNISVLFLSFPYILNALGYTFFYIAAYEFICAQSPHAMKGLLIGTIFTIKGVFQLIGATAILVPFTVWKLDTTFPSCGFVYYLVNIIVAVIGLVAYTWVARRYQYRQRDEPDNIYRYAEEYYDRD